MINFITRLFSSQSYIKRLANIVNNIKLMLLMAIIAGVIKFSAPLLITSVTSRLIDGVILEKTLTSTQRSNMLTEYVALVVIVFIFIWAPSTYFRQYLAEMITVRITSGLREKMLNHVFSLPFSFFQKRQSGELSSRIISDINTAATLVSGGLIYIWIDLASIAVVVFLIISEDPFVGGISLLSLPFYIYLMRFFRNRVRMASHKIQHIQGEISAYTQDRLTNIETIRSYNAHRREAENIHKLVTDYEMFFLKRSHIKSINLLIMGQLTQLPSVIILALGGYEVISEHLTVGSFIALTMYIRQIFWPLDRVSEFNVNFAAATASLDRIFQILDIQPENIHTRNNIKFPLFFSQISFKNISFSYDSTDRKVLSDISFSIHKGEILAVAGPSGSGKTTLARLLERMITCTTGGIYFDDIPIDNINLIEYRNHVKTVPQNPVLFSDTIKMNIFYPDKEASCNRLHHFCTKAGILDFIIELPDSFNYHVGERGNRLSGGQKQRIAISRALLSDSDIIIFDESTANLDGEKERVLYELISELRGKHTVIIIAHRPAVLDYVDRVVMLNSGRLESIGTPEYLKAHSSLFCKMFENNHV